MRCHKGFTLIELLVVIAIIGIGSALAAPSLRSFVQNYRVRSDTMSIISSLRDAQQAAIKEHKNAVIVFNVNADSFSAHVETCGNAWWYDSNCGDILLSSKTLDTNSDLTTNLNGNTFGFDHRSYPIGLPGGTSYIFIQSRVTNKWFRIQIDLGGTLRVQSSSDGANWQ